MLCDRNRSSVPKWRNWQTHVTQNHARSPLMWVRFPPSAWVETVDRYISGKVSLCR